MAYELDGDSIGPNYSGYLHTGINSSFNVYNDSIYNEDKTQKLKYSIAAYNTATGNDIITLRLKMLEFNDSIIEELWYKEETKIELGQKNRN